MTETDDDETPCTAGRRESALQRLYHYLDGELSDSEITEIREHLAHCPPCESEYSIESMLKDLVRRSCCETAPDGLRARIQERIVVETYRS